MISVIIPANNEEEFIITCLAAVLAAQGPRHAEIIVVANGCHDQTAARARTCEAAAATKGWTLSVLELNEGSKIVALNAGDAAASFDNRVYLDADVVVSVDLLEQLDALLISTTQAVYASGTLCLVPAQNWTTRAYAKVYAQVPFMTEGVPGAGLFAVNAVGRARWGSFPDIISDDTYVRLQFSTDERIAVPATYQWPLVEGLFNLIRVRRRQNAGVDEVFQRFPKTHQNDVKTPLGLRELFGIAYKNPIGFVIYCGVSLIVRLTPAKTTAGWSRGR